MILDLWELTGRRTDLEPFGADPGDYDVADIADSFGTRYWLRKIAEAERAITSYNRFGFKPLRFNDLIKDAYVQVDVIDLASFNRTLSEAPVVAGVSAETYSGNVLYFNGAYAIAGTVGAFDIDNVVVADFGLDDPQELIGEAVVIGGESYTISSVTEGAGIYTIYFSTDIDSVSPSDSVTVNFTFTEQEIFILSATDDGTTTTFSLKDDLDGFLPNVFTAQLRRNNFIVADLGFPEELRLILKVTDMDLAAIVKKGKRKESFFISPTDSGRPSFWEQRGGRLYFDTSIDDVMNFRFEILTVPEAVTLDGDFFLSEPFQSAIMAFVAMKTYGRSQDHDKAYAEKRNFEDLMRTIATEAASEFLRDDNYGFYVLKEQEEI